MQSGICVPFSSRDPWYVALPSDLRTPLIVVFTSDFSSCFFMGRCWKNLIAGVFARTFVGLAVGCPKYFMWNFCRKASTIEGEQVHLPSGVHDCSLQLWGPHVETLKVSYQPTIAVAFKKQGRSRLFYKPDPMRRLYHQGQQYAPARLGLLSYMISDYSLVYTCATTAPLPHLLADIRLATRTPR